MTIENPSTRMPGVDGHDDFGHGGHADEIGPHAAEHAIFGPGFEAGAGDGDEDPLAAGNAQLQRSFLGQRHQRPSRKDATYRGTAARACSSLRPRSGLSPIKLMWSSMITTSASSKCGFMPPAAFVTIRISIPSAPHHAHRERDLLHRVAFVIMKSPFHRHDGDALQRSHTSCPA